MRKAISVFFAFASLFSAPPISAATAYLWLCSQQQPTGLVDSYEGDRTLAAYTYDQAVAVIAFVLSGDAPRAKRILDRMAALQNAEGSWDDAFYADSAVSASSYRYCGSNSWMVMAINYFTHATGDQTYLPAAQKCAGWLLALQITNSASSRYGSFSGGLSCDGSRITWASTQHNFDAYSALKNLGSILNNQMYKDRAALSYRWVTGKMWEDATGRFLPGCNDFSTYLDPQSWAIAALGASGPSGQNFGRAASWVYENIRLTRTCNGVAVEGFDYDMILNGVWFEGTEQMSLAYELIGDSAKSEYFHRQTARVQGTNGGILASVGDGPTAWPTNYPLYNVAATAWFIFCSTAPKFNPFEPLTRDISPPIIYDVSISDIMANSAVISWKTNENSDSWAEYGMAASYGMSTAVTAVPGRAHRITLFALASGSTCHVRVFSKDAAGNQAVSGDYTFVTATLIKDYFVDRLVVMNGTCDGTCAGLKANEADYMSVRAALSGCAYAADWYATKTIADMPDVVTQLTVTYDGHYSGAKKQDLFLYNFGTGAWDRIDSRCVSASDQVITFTTTNAPSYISSGRQIRLRVSAAAATPFTCYADFVRFRVQLKDGVTGAPAPDGSFGEIDEGEIVTEEDDAPAPDVPVEGNGECKLYNNLFNPVRSEQARVDFTIGSDGRSAVRIYDLAGELVRTLVDEPRAAGNYIEYWNGRNDNGETVASGVYLVHIEAPGISATRKIAVLK